MEETVFQQIVKEKIISQKESKETWKGNSEKKL